MSDLNRSSDDSVLRKNLRVPMLVIITLRHVQNDNIRKLGKTIEDGKVYQSAVERL